MAAPFGFMPPTLTGQENDPNQQLMAAILAAGRGMDYSGPAPSGGPPPSPYAWAPQSVLQNDFAPMAQGTAMPQLPAEQEDLRQQMTGSGNLAMAAAPFALGPVLGPAMRTAGAFVRSNPIPAIAGALGFGAVPAATQSEPQQPSQLKIDPKDVEIGGAREGVADISKRKADVEKTLAELRASAQRFNAERLSNAKPEEIKEVQTILKRLNLYRGPIDGNWGSGTAAAVERRLAQITSEEERANKQLEGLTAQYTTENRRLTGLQRQQQRDRTEREMGTLDRAIRDYGTWASFVGGGVAGGASRFGATRVANRLTQTAADDANALISRNYSNVSGRVGGLNRFYEQGGGNEPFKITDRARGGFTLNRPVTPGRELYQNPNYMGGMLNPQIDAVALGGSSANALYQEYRLQQAEAQLAEAKAEADKNPTSAEHMDNLARAEARANQLRLQTRLQQGAPFGYAGGALGLRYRHVRPNVDQAAAEVHRLNRWRQTQPIPSRRQAP